MADTLEDTIGRLLDGDESTEAAPEEPTEEVEAAPEEAASAEEEAPAEETPEEQEARERDEQGRFKPKSAAPVKVLAKPGAKPAIPAEATEKPAEPAKPAFRAPQSWKPGAREALAKADPAIQEEAVRLDREYRQIMQQNAEIRRQHGEVAQRYGAIEQGLRPFEGIFRAEGTDSLTGAMNVVQTYAQLHFGSQQQKDAILHSLITRFGSIDGLNALLEGKAQPQAQPQYRPAPPQQPREDPRAIVREELAALRQEATQSKAQREWSAFEATNPEYLEVGPDGGPGLLPTMRALVRAWEIENQEAIANGDAPPYPTDASLYKVAYDTARQMNPRIRAIDDQRKALEATKVQKAKVAKARAAAVSVRSSPTVSTPRKPMSDHDAVAQAWDELENR